MCAWGNTGWFQQVSCLQHVCQNMLFPQHERERRAVCSSLHQGSPCFPSSNPGEVRNWDGRNLSEIIWCAILKSEIKKVTGNLRKPLLVCKGSVSWKYQTLLCKLLKQEMMWHWSSGSVTEGMAGGSMDVKRKVAVTFSPVWKVSGRWCQLWHCGLLQQCCDKAGSIIFVRLALSWNWIAWASCELSGVHLKMLMLLYIIEKMMECF